MIAVSLQPDTRARDCTGYDTAGCSLCGDDVIGEPEVCDGAGLAGEDCLTQGFDPEADVCAADEICATDAANPPNGVCLELGCMSAADCGPAPATGAAPVACMDVTGDGAGDCILNCEMGEVRPDGVTCLFNTLCVWPS